MGRLIVNNEQFWTIERPWVRSPHHLGGLNFESCIPDGKYFVQPYSSTDHPNVWILSNPDLHVFQSEPAGGEREGRWRILIHIGNYVKDVVGCVAVGLSSDGTVVSYSGRAIERLRVILKKENHSIDIYPKGARN